MNKVERRTNALAGLEGAKLLEYIKINIIDY